MVGDLPESEVDAICDHVPVCPACTTILRNLSHDQTLLDAVSPNANSWTADPDDRVAIEQLIARLQVLSSYAEPKIGSVSPNLSFESLPSSVDEGVTEIQSDINLDELAKPLLRPPTSAGELGWLGSYRVLGVLGSGGMGGCSKRKTCVSEDALRSRPCSRVFWGVKNISFGSCARPARPPRLTTTTSFRSIKSVKIVACRSSSCRS
ncbi:MAG: hypothetical protein EXS05_22775 [Planctomycetaceae bacterium]|nr:hypothetical protein [Planctomycetaceae bacterium]